MPFETGLAVALFLSDRKRKWHLLESQAHRIQKSLSDLNGYDAIIHSGTVEGMLASLLDIFPYKRNQPGPVELLDLYTVLRQVVKQNKLKDLFRPYSFSLLRYAAEDIAKRKGLIPVTLELVT